MFATLPFDVLGGSCAIAGLTISAHTKAQIASPQVFCVLVFNDIE